eukprot:1523159-Rhodomonas_salina.1
MLCQHGTSQGKRADGSADLGAGSRDPRPDEAGYRKQRTAVRTPPYRTSASDIAFSTFRRKRNKT